MIKIGIIIPEESGTFQEDAEFLSQKLGIEPVFCSGHFAAVIPTVRQMLRKHPDMQALISRSTTALYLRKHFELPVVDLELNDFDFAETISELPDRSGNFIVVQFTPSASTYNVEAIAKVCGIQLKTIFLDPNDPREIVQAVREAGGERVVSSVAVVSIPCRKAGIEVIPLRFSPKTIENALRRALYLVESRKDDIRRSEQLLQVLNAFSEGFLAVDQQGKIVMCNQALCDIAEIQSFSLVGASLEETKSSIHFIRLLTEAKDNGVVDYHGEKYIVNRPFFFSECFLKDIWCVSSLSNIQEKSTIYQKKLVNDGYRARYHFNDIVSADSVMQTVKDRAKHYAHTDCNILILGESGTGKEMLAQSIHNESRYRDGPFVAINCAALPESLLESELFGYEGGAFTGAQRGGKKGLIELSDHGTLFLDEIGAMPLTLQAKLLRSIQERQVSHLGGTQIIAVENRIICATNENLVEAVKNGEFRADLYYRLDVLNIRIPPLRERTEDIPFLVRTFLRRMGIARHRLVQMPDSLMHYFTSYSWQGNFRQLQALLERIYTLNSGVQVEEELLRQLFKELPEGQMVVSSSGGPVPSDREQPVGEDESYRVSGTMVQMEEQIIREAYRRHNGNITELVQALGIGRTTLWRKLKELGLRNGN